MEISKGELDVLKKTNATEKEKTQDEKSKLIDIKTGCGQTVKTPSRYLHYEL